MESLEFGRSFLELNTAEVARQKDCSRLQKHGCSRRCRLRRAKSRRGRRAEVRQGACLVHVRKDDEWGAGVRKTGAKRSPGFGKQSTRDANKPEEEKNWWASAHFRILGAGAVGVNLARSDARIGRANKLGIGLALCWSRSFIVSAQN